MKPTKAERKLWALQEAVIRAGEAAGLDAVGRIMMYEQTAAWVQEGNSESLEGALEELLEHPKRGRRS